ncbi:MAG: SET domain-containing protein [Minisyncoccia bacterium]
MKKAQLAIKKSPIHGYGVFAQQSLKKGQFISELKGARVVYESKILGLSNRYPDWIGIGKNTWIDPVDEFEYLNHSCNPNAGLKGNRILKLYALRNIAEGEEITIDYAITEEDPDYCFENFEPEHEYYRRFVGPIQTLPRDVYERYLPFIPERFKKVYENEIVLKGKHGKE